MYITHSNSIYSEDPVLLDHIPYPQYVHRVSTGGMPVEQGLKIMPMQLIDYVLAGKGMADTGTSDFIRKLTQHKRARVGFLLAAGNNSWTGYITNIKRTNAYPSYKLPVMGISQVQAGYIANRIGAFEYIATDSTSCISGHSAWYTAKNMLALDRLNAMVVISVDNSLSEEYLTIFGENGLSKLATEEEDKSVKKFRLGDGCNITVFESLASIVYSKHDALAEVMDMHIASEYYSNPLGISPTGEGYKKVIDKVDTTGIKFVKTHNTYSEDNQVEKQILEDRFGDIKLVSYKLRIGHTMGASTAIETALAIKEESGRFLSLGAGMGNVFSSAVVDIL